MLFRIRELREERGLSTYALAKKAGIARATLWTMETKEDGVVMTKTLLKVAKALEVPVADLFLSSKGQPIKQRKAE